MDKLEFSNRNLRKFGFVMGIAFLVLFLLVFLKKRTPNITFFYLSAAFFVPAILSPWILKPIYLIWMRFAFLLSWVNTRIILVVLFYLVFTPIGLIMKVLKKDLLDLAIKRDQDSYWRRKEEKDFDHSSYERQF